MRVAVAGAGIGGLVLALELHRRGIEAELYEAAPEIRPLGVGINILPHASRVLSGLGLADALATVGIRTAESAFFNRFGQLIYREPAGVAAGFRYAQYSIHRADLHAVLLAAAHERLGREAIHLDHTCVDVTDEAAYAILHVRSTTTGESLPDVRADVVIACDGVHSALRRRLFPDEGSAHYTGVNMWRGVIVGPPMLSGATMTRAGWLDRGKLVVYPIRDNVDSSGNQLLNWVAEIETPRQIERDWGAPGHVADFIGAYEDWHFDWLDVPAMMRASDPILEYPMVDQEPLPYWTRGRLTLLGDAAHPMVPRGSNGAGQAILDAEALAGHLGDCAAAGGDPRQALLAYEAVRLPATSDVVRTNRQNPPDAIIREVRDRTNDAPFNRIDDVISEDELAAITRRYRDIVGLSNPALLAGSDA